MNVDDTGDSQTPARGDAIGATKTRRMPRLGDELMLCNISVANLALEEVIPAAAAAGFSSISVLARAHRRALASGITNADLRSLLVDNDIVVQEVEAVGDWLGGQDSSPEPWMDFVYDSDQMFELANELGSANVVAAHFGAPAPHDEAVEAFARLCDRAAANDLTVALEFPAMATIADVSTAWAIVEAADRTNGGILLDNWHHRRSVSTDEDLDQVSAGRIFSVQLSDAMLRPVGTLMEDVMQRTLPGTGELGVVDMLRQLDARGVRCPLGIEVLRRDVVQHGALEAARMLHGALARVVADARSRV